MRVNEIGKPRRINCDRRVEIRTVPARSDALSRFPCPRAAFLSGSKDHGPFPCGSPPAPPYRNLRGRRCRKAPSLETITRSSWCRRMYAHPPFRVKSRPIRSQPCPALAAGHASWSVTCQLERKMAYFDYGAAAELFPGRQRTKMMAAVTYMRFAAAAEAIRYAVEEIPANSFLGTFLEVNEERFDCNGIRRLYDSAEYPLPRQPAAIRDRLLSVRRGA